MTTNKKECEFRNKAITEQHMENETFKPASAKITISKDEFKKVVSSMIKDLHRPRETSEKSE